MNSKNRKLLQKNTLMYREASSILENFLEDDRQKSEIPQKYLWQSPARSFIPLGTKRGIMVGLSGAVEGHLAIIGGTGDGKSTTIKFTLLMWLYSLVCTDPKGELSCLYMKMYKHGVVKRPAIVFNPNDPDGPHFDPFEVIWQNPEDVNLLIREIVHTLLPSVFDTSEAYWRASAQGVLEAALLFYYKQGYPFINAIQDILSLPLSELCFQIKIADPESYTRIGQIGDTDNKNLAIIDREIRNAISVFEDPKIAAAFSQGPGKTFSWQDIDRYNIFLSIPDEMIETWGAAFNIMYSQLFYLLAKRPEKYSSQCKNLPVLIIMDEFARMGRLEAVERAVSTLRSKSVNFLFSLQSLAQLDKIYGTYVRRIILDNCRYKLILGARDAETQQMLADLTGTFLSSSISTSASRGVDSKINYSFTESQMREYSKNPHEFGFLQDTAVCLTPHGNYDIAKCKMRELNQLAIFIKNHRKKGRAYHGDKFIKRACAEIFYGYKRKKSNREHDKWYF